MKTKHKRALCVIVAALIILIGCGAVKLDNKKTSRSIVTAQGTICPLSDLSTLMIKTVQDINRDDQCDNLILFVHGRGKHPGKAFRQKLLTDLETDYSARVIMFHWPSWEGALAFPEQAARDSADDFISVLGALKTFKDNHADLTRNVKFTLLTQSMGSLVLEESILRRQDESMQGLFDTLVISAPASYTKDHAQWVNQMDLSEHIYILFNRDDPILGSAGIREMGRRLGKGLKSRGEAVELSDQAIYIDATNILLLHRYYLHRNLKWAPELKHFFDEVLNGLPATLDTDSHIVQIHKQKTS